MHRKQSNQLEHAEIHWASLASHGKTFDIVAEAVSRFENLSIETGEQGWQITAAGVIYQPVTAVGGILLKEGSTIEITSCFLRCYKQYKEVMVLSFKDGHRIQSGDISADRLARRHQCTESEAQAVLLKGGILDGFRIRNRVIHKICG